MKLRQGDIILVSGKKWLSRAICWFQQLWSKDGEAKYDHAALVTASGTLFESTSPNIGFYFIAPDHYLGSTVKVFRCKEMTLTRYLDGCLNVYCLDGKKYPLFRLLVLFPLRLAKYIHWKRMVCSEVVAKFLTDAGLLDCYWGADVDYVHDFMRDDDRFEVLFEGKLRDYIGA
jgi:hypothetical protein